MERAGSIAERPPAGHRTTKLNVTLSTLKRPGDAQEEAQLKGLVNDFQRAVALDSKVRADIFGADTSYHINLTPGVPEVGKHANGSRVHIHFQVSAPHSGSWYAPDIQKRMREVFIKYAQDKGVPLKGAYAHVQLGNAYYENYIAKEGTPGNHSAINGKRSAGYLRMLDKQRAAALK